MAEKSGEPAMLYEHMPPTIDLDADLSPEQKAKDKAILRKIDLIILPLCVLNYFFSSMDRTDIGNAKVAGFQTDVGLSNYQYSLVVSLFYVGYITFQPIGALSIRITQPHIVLGCANIIWGIATTLMTLSKSTVLPGILRVIVGAAEGMTEINGIYLTMWYTHQEYAVRTGIWYSFGVLAGAFNGAIAAGIQSHVMPTLKAWQLLYIIEGFLPIVFGGIIMWLYPPVPEKVKKFFTEEEKKLILARTKAARNTPDVPITVKGVLSVFKQPQVYGMWIIYFCVIWAASGYGNFLPSIINGLGFSPIKSQLLTVPMAATGFISINFFCFISDRFQRRGPLVIALASVSFAGFAILAAVPTSVPPRIVALVLIAIGNQPLIPLMLTWINVNTAGLSRRAIAISLQNCFGQTGGLSVSFVFTNPPRYLDGTEATLGVLGSLIVTAIALEMYFFFQNRKKLRNADSDWCHQNRHKTYDELGTDHPDFMFTL